MKSRRRHLFLAALELTAFLWLLAASQAAGENVKVGIPSLTITMMPLAVAQERGYFNQEGLQYHRRAETLDGRIDAALAAETIRETREAEGISREIAVGQLFDFSYLEPLP